MKSAFKPDHIDFYKFYSWQFVSELIHWMKIYFPWSTVRALGTKPLGSHFPRVIFLWKEHVRLNFSVMEVQCFQLLQKILQLRNSYCTQKLLRFKRTYPSVLSITYKPTKHTKCTLYLIDTDQTTSFQFFIFYFLKTVVSWTCRIIQSLWAWVGNASCSQIWGVEPNPSTTI